jgi:hypothetical protein
MTLEIPVITRKFGRIGAAPNREVEFSPGPNRQIDVTDWRATVNSIHESQTAIMGAPVRNTDATFWALVHPTGFCWEWTGTIGPEGYAIYWLNGASVPVHRIAYANLIGPIPDGMQLDHLCLTRHCVNPDHLEPVTPTENSRRANVHKMNRSHCANGHEWTEANTLPMRDAKRCRQCILVRDHVKRGIACSYAAFCEEPVHLRDKYELRDECQRGHSMADAYVRPDSGARTCRTCQRIRRSKLTTRRAA